METMKQAIDNHEAAIQLGEAQVVANASHISGKSYAVIQNMYVGSMFMRTGGHFVRCIIALKPMLQERLRVVKAPPPPAAEHEAPEWKDTYS